MPASKAILRDISDGGLDPQKAHTRCAHDGRLVRPSLAVEIEPIVIQDANDNEVHVLETPVVAKVVEATQDDVLAEEKKAEKDLPSSVIKKGPRQKKLG